MIKAVENGTVELYHDGTKKFETKSTGVEVVGRYAFDANNFITCNTTANTMEFVAGGFQIGEFNSAQFTFLDDKQARFGNGSDLRIYHQSSNGQNYIDSRNGDLYFLQGAATKAIITGGDFRPGTANTIDLGVSSAKWQNVHAVRYYGDGSNLTGISAGGLKQTAFDSANSTSGETSFSTSYVEVLSQNITPSDSSNKVVVFSAVQQYIANTSGNLYALPQAFRKLTRTVSGTETTLVEDSVLSQRDNYNGTKYQEGMSSLAYQDSPNTTSQVTYKIYFKRNSNTNSANVGHRHMTLMETAV